MEKIISPFLVTYFFPPSFRRSETKSSAGTQIPLCAPCFSCSPPNLNIYLSIQPIFCKRSNSSLCRIRQHSTSKHLTFFTSQRSTFSPAYLHQEDKRALPRKFESSKFCFPSCIECSFFHHTPRSSSFPSGVKRYSYFLFLHLSF